MGYLLPSFTLNINEAGHGLEIYVNLPFGDSHSAFAKPPKMKPSVVSTIASVHPFQSQHLWKSEYFQPSTLAS